MWRSEHLKKGWENNLDGLAKSLKSLLSVIPAPYPVVGSNRQLRGKLQQESSLFRCLEFLWIPVFTPAR